MISAAQLAQRRAQATRLVKQAFPTTISIDDGEPIAAAAWSGSSSATSELAGLLATYDKAFRVETALLTGVTIVEERTIITEDGKRYRVERKRAAKGDPAIVLECKAV